MQGDDMINEETLKKFCDAWIEDEPTPEEREAGDADDADVEIRGCFLDFEHAGRYTLKFRNQGFATSDFGGYSYDEETSERSCPFYGYVTSPDVNYYDGIFETKSRAAYDVALFHETFSKKACFVELSDMLGELFGAVRSRDYKKLADSKFSRFGISFDETGKVVVDGDPYDLILTLTIIPQNQPGRS